MTASVARAVKATKEPVNVVPFLRGSNSEDDYREALELVGYLIEEDDTNPLIDFLTSRIAEYESNSEKFTEFDKAVAAVPVGVVLLRALIDQYNLTYTDLKNEIGSKSPVSQTLSEQRSLTISHIKTLSARFGVKPEWFLWLMTDAKLPDALRLSGFERVQVSSFAHPCLSFRLLSLLFLIY